MVNCPPLVTIPSKVIRQTILHYRIIEKIGGGSLEVSVPAPFSDQTRRRRAMCCSVFFLVALGVASATDVLTYHNDKARSGQNLQETILTTTNVNSATFGKLFTMPVDGIIDAEYLSEVSFPDHHIHNVLYVVTEHDRVYAFDADTGVVLWQVSLLRSGETPAGNFSCGQISPQIGITSTPVIDRSSGLHGTIYVVAMSKKSSSYFQRIHGLDVTTGREEFGGPVVVQAKYPGKGDNSHNGYVVFDPKQYAERQALILLNHVVYTGWTSHCDHRPYTGWLIGYNENTLQQTSVLNLTPNGSEGSIWQSGAGMASDGTYLYLLDANGTFDTTLNSRGFPQKGDFGQAFLKLSTASNQLAVADYFEMYNGPLESDEDQDFGSGGALLLPAMKDASGTTRYLAIGAGKDSNIYIVDRTNLGKFHPTTNQIYQEFTALSPEGCGPCRHDTQLASSSVPRKTTFYSSSSRKPSFRSPQSPRARLRILILEPPRASQQTELPTPSFGQLSIAIPTMCCTPTVPRTCRRNYTDLTRLETAMLSAGPVILARP
jgi:hypothetical protein